jgi:hypothetical protein
LACAIVKSVYLAKLVRQEDPMPRTPDEMRDAILRGVPEKTGQTSVSELDGEARGWLAEAYAGAR